MEIIFALLAIAVVVIGWQFWRLWSSFSNGGKDYSANEVAEPHQPSAAEQYYGKQEKKPYNKTGVSYFYVDSKAKEAAKRKQRNRNRAAIQRQSRKTNLVAC